MRMRFILVSRRMHRPLCRIAAVLLCALAAGAAELPSEASKAIDTYEKKRVAIEAAAAKDKGKEREALRKELQKAVDRESRAERWPLVRELKAALDEIAAEADGDAKAKP